MRNMFRCIGGLAGSVLTGAMVAAQPAPPAASRTNEAHAAAVELLRQVIKEQQLHPNKIIREPAAAADLKDGKAQSAAVAPGARLNRADLEREYLEGRITAKQFQRAAEELEKNPPPPAPAAVVRRSAPKPAEAAGPAKPPPGNPAKGTVVAPPAAATVPAEEAPEQKALTDVEKKLDQILSRRDAQIREAQTNATSLTNTPAGPLTKRQKLDALLRDLIQGKTTEKEYNALREKVVAEPD